MSSEKQLVAYVHVRDVGGRTVAYGPGEDVPAWARKQITNPKAWGEGEAAATSSAEAPPPAGTGDDLEAPPRAGKGSGVDAWRAFAERKGVDVDQDATREQIIAACEAAGVVEREE
ncbi:hypothetical protein [Streptomyces swartbergensis]|uniref:Uncharacterized protein n=1 Tax=Streptomyces swartbergensis TaxID=487165 RepID=A0A243S4M5_9ACTN|nr:hypothetical protein [Streptomyces swartbergensis]OUD02565.1 hypothetical protein CA983_14160 [Streptomyces swartbergensis]